MRTRLLIVFVFYLVIQSASAKLDVGAIKWDDVKTKVRWLNFYEKSTLLNLVVDEYPALKRVGTPGYFAPTKFPSGNFPCEIVDAYSGDKMINLQIDTAGESQYCLITFGAESQKIQSIYFSESAKVAKAKQSTLTIYNMLPDGDLQWQLPEVPLETIAIGKGRQITFDTATGCSMKIPVKAASGSKTMKLEVAPDASGNADGNWVAFCHYGGPTGKDLEMSYIKQGTSVFILGGAKAHEQ